MELYLSLRNGIVSFDRLLVLMFRLPCDFSETPTSDLILKTGLFTLD